MTIQNGEVRSSAEFDNKYYATIRGSNTSAFFAGIWRTYQNSVDTSDSVRKLRATLDLTTQTMKDIDLGLKGIGNKLDAADPAAPYNLSWTADSDKEAMEVGMALMLAGQAPPALGATPAERAQQTAHFWRDAAYPLSPARWEETTGAANTVLVQVNGVWNYRGSTSQPIRSYDPAALNTLQEFTDELETENFPPGTLVKKANTSDYYIVAADHSLVPFADPTQPGNLTVAAKQADQDTILEWKKVLKSAHDQIATVAQTQTQYMLSLTGNLQASLTALTSLINRFDRFYSSMTDKI